MPATSQGGDEEVALEADVVVSGRLNILPLYLVLPSLGSCP